MAAAAAAAAAAQGPALVLGPVRPPPGAQLNLQFPPNL